MSYENPTVGTDIDNGELIFDITKTCQQYMLYNNVI